MADEWGEYLGPNVARHPRAGTAPGGDITVRQIQPVGGRNIPPREWLYGRYLMLGNAAILGAIDGGGKGAISVGMILSVITGRPLLGERIWRPGPVAIISYEDDEDEWHRRLAAACDHFAVDYELIVSNVHFITKNNGRVSFATRLPSGAIHSDAAEISERISNIAPVLVVIDPFNHAHQTDDGNNNVVIAQVAQSIVDLARATHCAVLVLHHLRKGQAGGSDDLMGALALRATFRMARILSVMTEKQAQDLGLDDHWRYIRVSDGKQNYAPPSDKGTWFKLLSVPLHNGTEEYPEGDTLPVATVHELRKAFHGMDIDCLRQVFDAYRKADYVPGRRSKEWCGNPLMLLGRRHAKEAATIVEQWLANNVLMLRESKAPGRNKKEVVALNEVRAAEILADLARDPETTAD